MTVHRFHDVAVFFSDFVYLPFSDINPHQVIIILKNYTNISWNISLPDGKMCGLGSELTGQIYSRVATEFYLLPNEDNLFFFKWFLICVLQRQ